MRRLVCEFYDGFSFGRFVRRYPELRGTVTDLLIGDLFTDRVDKVWPAMESLYEAGEAADPAMARRRSRTSVPDAVRTVRPQLDCSRTVTGPDRLAGD